MNPEKKKNNIPDNDMVEVEIDNLFVDLSGKGDTKGDLKGDSENSSSDSSSSIDSNTGKANNEPSSSPDKTDDISDGKKGDDSSGGDTSNPHDNEMQDISDDDPSDKNSEDKKEEKDKKDDSEKSKDEKKDDNKDKKDDSEKSNDDAAKNEGKDAGKDASKPGHSEQENPGQNAPRMEDNFGDAKEPGKDDNLNKDQSKNPKGSDNGQSDKPESPSSPDSGKKNQANGSSPSSNNGQNQGKNNPSGADKSKGNKPNKDANKQQPNKSNHKKDNNTPKKGRNNKNPKSSGRKNPLKRGGGKNAGSKAADVTSAAKKKVAEAAKKLIMFLITHPIILGIIVAIIIFFVIIMAALNVTGAMTTPGQGSDINSPTNTFSARDQKILEKVNAISGINKPNAEMAIYAVLFPYFKSLQNGAVDAYINTDATLDAEEQEEYNKYAKDKSLKDSILESFGCEDLCQELLGDDGVQMIIKAYAKKTILEGLADFFCNENSTSWFCTEHSTETGEDELDSVLSYVDDPYLKLFKRQKYREKLEKILEHVSDSATNGEYASETDLINYLKTEYFEGDAGYKALLIQTKDPDGLKQAIIDQLEYGALDYEVYIKKDANTNCTSDAVSLGYSYAGDIIKGEPVIVLKDTGSGNFNNIKSASAVYGTEDYHLDLKRYVMGVAYAEVGDGVKNEAVAKSAMITAKSFVLGRTASGSNNRGDVGMGFKPDYIDGKTVFYMRPNTGDQDFCDVYEGCKSGSKYAKNLQKNPYNSETYENTKDPLDEKSRTKLEEWYDATASEFIYNSKWNKFGGNQYDKYNSSCVQGSCYSQTKAASLANSGKDYEYILFKEAFTDAGFGSYDMTTSTISKINTVCNNVTSSGACGIPYNDFIFYSQLNYNDSEKDKFCGRNSTISSSGCGVTSMAMVLANLYNSSIEPHTTMNDAYTGFSQKYCGEGIVGTNSGFYKAEAEKYGLTYHKLSSDKAGAEKAVNVLKQGGLVVVSVNNSSDFTTGDSGHYLVIRSIEADGQTVHVANPNRRTKDDPQNTQSFNIYDFINKGWINTGWHGITSAKSSEIVQKYCTSSEVTNPTGEKKAATGILGYPVGGGASGCNMNFPSYSGHTGIDINGNQGAKAGDPILAADNGTVIESKDLKGCDGRQCKGGYYSYGRVITIDHHNGYKTKYAHLKERLVNYGDHVVKGQKIGTLGNNGNTQPAGENRGYHLHFELIKNGTPINGCKYMNKNYTGGVQYNEK